VRFHSYCSKQLYRGKKKTSSVLCSSIAIVKATTQGPRIRGKPSSVLFRFIAIAKATAQGPKKGGWLMSVPCRWLLSDRNGRFIQKTKNTSCLSLMNAYTHTHAHIHTCTHTQTHTHKRTHRHTHTRTRDYTAAFFRRRFHRRCSEYPCSECINTHTLNTVVDNQK
jgi:hypothetical protein